MKFTVMTLFPEMFHLLHASILGRAEEAGLLDFQAVDIREYTTDKHRKVDDYPYGGGAGMLMQAEPIWNTYQALYGEKAKKPRVIYTTPWGRVFHQDMARELAKEEELCILCGHYEGVDERVLEEIVTDPISIGDYVVTGGELPAMIIIDTISRMVPGVLTNAASGEEESFTHGLLEYPQYSRPEVFLDKPVPEVLLSGHHKNIEEWRRRESLLRTAKMRPDLLAGISLTKEEEEWLKKCLQ